MTRQCAWTEHWKLQFHAKTVAEYVTETRRHTVRRGDADEEVAELILTPAERNVSWTVDQIKARCSELYGKAPRELGLNAGRRGTQPSDKPIRRNWECPLPSAICIAPLRPSPRAPRGAVVSICCWLLG